MAQRLGTFYNPKVGDPLTPGQADVARLVATGKHNKEVAEILKISIYTVKCQLNFAFRKLGVRNRVELANKLNAR